MPVSVAMPKQAMKPTQTATLKSIGGRAPTLSDFGEQEHEERAAGKGFGDGEHHQGGVGQVVVSEIEDDEDQHDDGGEDDAEGLSGADLMFEFAAPF